MFKIFKGALIFFGILFVIWLISWRFDFGGEPAWGVTFSQFYAGEILGLDWKKAYLDILDDFNIKKIRLVAYWQYLEPQKGDFNFGDLDWQIEEAGKRNKEIVLAAGYRVPRWPECHFPEWAGDLETSELNQAVLGYLSEIIRHYKPFPAIKTWQIENEPLVSVFGECPRPDRAFLEKEISLVKSLDPQRPIMITDSGELSLWLRTSGLSEVLGTTLYRIVWDKSLGWWKHIYPPAFYTLRAFFAKTFTKTQEVVISELQAEPWLSGGKDALTRFSAEHMKENLNFARKTGLKDIYLWGAEWWYWRKENGDASYWRAVKEMLK